MDAATSWTFACGRILGIPLRVHFSLLIVLPLPFLWMSWQVALAMILVIGLSVLLHEIGHALMSRRLGQEPMGIVLWPLGGLAVGASCPGWAWGDVLVYAAGPAVTLALAVVAGALWQIAALLEGPDALGQILYYAMFINLLLFGFNMLPSFPLDGGGILRGILWARSGNKVAATIKAIEIARWVLGALAIVSVVWLDSLYLLVLSLYLIWQGEQTRQTLLHSWAGEAQGGSFGYDFSEGYRSLERGAGGGGRGSSSKPGWWQQRRQRRAQERAEREAAELARIRQQVDALLERVSGDGLDSLSEREREFLRRASERFKHRP